MNDYDIEVLGLVEKKVKEARKEIVFHTQFLLSATSLQITNDTREALSSIELEINRLRPADGDYTLRHIMMMRKIFDAYRRQIEDALDKVQSHLLKVSEYVETYVAHGVSPKELDVGGISALGGLCPVGDLLSEMLSCLSGVHPQAHRVFAGVDLSREKTTESIVAVCGPRLRHMADYMAVFAKVIGEQRTFLMSGDGLQKRRELLLGVSTLYDKIEEFFSKE